MHDFIYQIGLEPISEEEYVDVDLIDAGEYVTIDYVYELDDELRMDAIKTLIDFILPKGLFSFNEEECSLTYKGGLNKWKQAHIDNLINTAKTLTVDNVLRYIGPLHDIQKSLLNPLNTTSIFVMETEGKSGVAENSADLLFMFDHLKVGEKIYIGEIFGYHY